MLRRPYLLTLNVGAVAKHHIWLEPAALTGIVVRLETYAEAQTVFVQPQFVLHGIEHFLRTVQVIHKLIYAVPCRNLHCTLHDTQLAVEAVHQVLSAHFTLYF